MTRWISSCLIFLACMSLTIQARAITLDPSDELGDIFTKFRQEMSALIAQAGGEARTTLTHAFALTDQLISTLETTYADSLKLTFDELDNQQKKLFSDTNAMLGEIERTVGGRVDEALDLGAKFNAVLADFASIWSDKPLITSYSPLYVPPKSAGRQSVTIAVQGNRLNLGTAEPKLSILGTTYVAAGYDDTQISFVVDLNQISEPGNVTAELVLYRPPSGWRGWVWWTEYEEITYRLLLNVLPDDLGSFVNEKVVVESIPITKNFVSPRIRAEKNGGGTDTKDGCWVPEEGFEFDMNSARAIVTAKTAYKDNDTSVGTNVGTVVIDTNRHSRNRICIIVTASTGCTECGGMTEGRLEVTMVKTEQKDVVVTGTITNLSWTEDVEVSLDTAAKRQTIVVTLFDGIARRHAADQSFKLPFLKGEPNRNGTSLILRPVRLWAD